MAWGEGRLKKEKKSAPKVRAKARGQGKRWERKGNGGGNGNPVGGGGLKGDRWDDGVGLGVGNSNRRGLEGKSCPIKQKSKGIGKLGQGRDSYLGCGGVWRVNLLRGSGGKEPTS